MSSMNISIKDDAYRFLKSIKSENESFSDVILSFKNKKVADGKFLVGFRNKFDGKINDVDSSDIERDMKIFRDEVEKRFDKTKKYMEKEK
jgi:predicted CopG family antitoxin